MSRRSMLAGHLPPLYREGALLGALTDLWGTQFDMLDEASISVQRAHWFDATPDFDEAVALAALLDIGPESFHANLGEFRAWVDALRDARLRGGAVTREALRILVDSYSQGFQRAAGIELVPPIAAWATAPDGTHAALVENPTRLRHARLPEAGGLEPLARLHVNNGGLDPAPWAVVLTGIAGGSEFAPLLANRTTGHAVVFRGEIPVGARLTIAPDGSDRTVLRADLEGQDVTDRLDTYPLLIPGPDGPGEPSATNETSLLECGDNELWFLPLAHYDAPGLGRVLLALAEDSLRMGRFNRTGFDHALFAQRPQLSAWVAWAESVPATIEIRLPAHTLRSEAEARGDAIAARERLEAGLDAAVAASAAAGVATEVTMDSWADSQPSRDRLVAVLPRTFREIAPTGAERLLEMSGVFDVTDFDDSLLA